MTVGPFNPQDWKGIGGLHNGKYRQSHQASHDNPPQASSVSNPGAADPSAFTLHNTYTTADTAKGTNSPAIEEAGISAGEFIGCRCWIIHSLKDMDKNIIIPRLGSVFYFKKWEPYQVEESHKLPGTYWYGPGIHAYKGRDDMMWDYGNPDSDRVYGTVYLWGVVIEHERGYRAQYASIRSLDELYSPALMGRTYPERQEMLNQLRQIYGVSHDA